MNSLKKNLGSIPFLAILKKAWLITWKNKFLWWFGLFLALVNFNFSSNWKEEDFDQQAISSFIHQNSHWLLPLAVVIGIIFLALIVFSFVSRGGLIAAIDRLEKNEKTNFKKNFSSGKKSFSRILGINLTVCFSSLIMIVVIALPAAYCFISQKIATGIWLSIPTFLIILVILLLASYLKNFGQIYIVTGKLKVLSALESAYKLFLNNFWTSIAMGAILIVLSLVLSFVFLAVLFVLGIIFVPLGFLLWSTLKEPGLIATATLGVPITLAALLLISAIFKVFHQSAWFLFFKEIASQKEEEIIAEISEEKTVISKSPDPVSGVTTSEID